MRFERPTDDMNVTATMHTQSCSFTSGHLDTSIPREGFVAENPQYMSIRVHDIASLSRSFYLKTRTLSENKRTKKEDTN